MRFMYSYGKYWYGESERISKFAEKRKGLIGTRLSKSLKQYNKDLQKSYDEYRQLNLITSSVGFNTYKDAQKQAIKSSKQLSGMFGILAEVKAGSRDYNQFAKVSGKTLRARQGAIEFTDKFYQAPDAAIKVLLLK